MSIRLPILVLVGVLPILHLVPALAHGQELGAAVAPFEGRRSRAVERAVRRAAGDTFDVARRGATRRAARRAGVEGTGPDGVTELAQALEVDVVLQGEVEGRGRSAQVTLVARAADGEELGRETTDFPRGRAARRAFADTIEGLCARAADAIRARDAEPEPEPEPPPVASEPEPVEEPREGPTDGLAVLAATLGIVGRTRDASIDLADGGRRAYASGLYPELRVAVEARPLAHEPDAARGLFLRGSFAHSVGLGSQTEGAGVSVESTNFVRFDVDAGFLFWVDALEIGFAFGFGYDGYHLADNDVLPTAEYLYLRPGARARVRLLDDETLVLGIDAAYRAILSRGALSDDFGADGDTHGLDLGVSLGGNLFAAADVGFTWAVGVEYVGLFASFAGAALDAPATGGSEHHVCLRAELGWSF